LIVWVLNLDRTVVYTCRATRAFALRNIPGLFNQGDPEVSSFSFYPVNFGVAQDLNIGIPADLDQFGCEYSHGTVIGRKGLVKLGHVAANGWRLVHQINLKAGTGKIERGLNTADPSTHNHDVSGMIPKLFFSSFFLHFSYILFSLL